jgi:hypothetical protein
MGTIQLPVPLYPGNIDVVDVTNPLEHTTHEVQLQIHPGEQPGGGAGGGAGAIAFGRQANNKDSRVLDQGQGSSTQC